MGAVAVKNSVYALPRSDAAQEDLQWILQEIVRGGGDASICEARFVYGLVDEQVEALFRSARKVDYDELAAAVRRLTRSLPRKAAEIDEGRRAHIEGEIRRLSKRLGEVSSIDFFGMSEREVIAGLISGVEAAIAPKQVQQQPGTPIAAEAPRGVTWVTRKGIHVDRMASAWLIRRFIDKDAIIKYVTARGYSPLEGEVRFDMFEGEYSHDGDRCTFETLLSRFGLHDPALAPIAEIVHDIDLKDSKFGRQDAIGFDRLITGIALANEDDEMRLSRASAVLDDLYEYFKRKPDSRRRGGEE